MISKIPSSLKFRHNITCDRVAGMVMNEELFRDEGSEAAFPLLKVGSLIVRS